MRLSLDYNALEQHICILAREQKELKMLTEILNSQYQLTRTTACDSFDFYKKQLQFAKEELDRVCLRCNTLMKTAELIGHANQTLNQKIEEAKHVQRRANDL